MATQPGTPAAAMPAGEDALIRRVADLERFVRELGPSIARSFSGTVADLAAAQADLEAQQSALTDTQADLATAQDELATAQDDLAKQQDYLNSLVTYTTTGGGGVTSATGVTEFGGNPVIEFTLTEARNVQVTAIAGWLGTASANGTACGVLARMTLLENGGAVTESVASGGATVSGVPHSVSPSGALVASKMMRLAAGTHTITTTDVQIEVTGVGMGQITGIDLTVAIVS